MLEPAGGGERARRAGAHGDARETRQRRGGDHDAAGRQFECEIIDQKPVAKTLGQAVEIDHVLAEPLGHGYRDLRGLALLGGV